ncbi:MAG TPA: dockerin type I domain-containing protein [Armatimonadota bacterium]|jgi:hypothetical protein
MRFRSPRAALPAALFVLSSGLAHALPIPSRQGGVEGFLPPEAPQPQGVSAAPYGAVGGGSNGNLSAVNALLSGVGLYIGIEWGSWTDARRQQAISEASNWGFAFLSPKIATEGGKTWYSSGAQLDNWIAWCSAAGIKFFPYSYVNPSTGGTGTTVATNRAAQIAGDIAQHCGLVLVDMEAEWQTDGATYYGPQMAAFGTAYRSVCPNTPIVVTGFGDPKTVQGSAWPYTEMRSFADAYAPQWYYPWWSWYRGTKGVAGVKNVIDTCYSQCAGYFGSAYPMLPNAAWENDPSDAATPAALPDLYAGTAYMRKFNAPIIWWEYQYMTRAIASALVGYGYFTDQPVPSGSPARPSAIVASSGSVASAGSVTLTINIGGPAPPGGQAIALASSNSAALPAPASVTVARGAASAQVTLTAGTVNADTSVTISAKNTATGTTVSASKTLTVLAPPMSLIGMDINPATVIAGQTAVGSVTLDGPAPAGGVTVSLSSDSAAAKPVSDTVIVPANSATGAFTISTSAAISAQAQAVISATLRGATYRATLTVNPIVVSGLTLSPATVQSGQVSTATVTLNSAAPIGGLFVDVTSDNPSGAAVVAPAPVYERQTAGTASIVGQWVSKPTTVQITAAMNGGSATEPLTVLPSNDLNEDGVVDFADVQLILQMAAGFRVATSEDFLAADLDGSGAIDLADATTLARLVGGFR